MTRQRMVWCVANTIAREQTSEMTLRARTHTHTHTRTRKNTHMRTHTDTHTHKYLHTNTDANKTHTRTHTRTLSHSTPPTNSARGKHAIAGAIVRALTSQLFSVKQCRLWLPPLAWATRPVPRQQLSDQRCQHQSVTWFCTDRRGILFTDVQRRLCHLPTSFVGNKPSSCSRISACTKHKRVSSERTTSS
jgi:hypothetical protein